ncbi:FG-GAP repeat protein [Streptomyces sp. NPDC008313]|uniref:FG-GAP repeat protein n=1 Tax=Streptomyces sp. NPDC008313 TaxID=3364826 RepID=UPI0036E360C4
MRIRTYATSATVTAIATAVAAAATAGLALAPTASAAPASAPEAITSDLNGDGYPDLAVGVPDASVGGDAKAGYVNVVWGGPNGVGSLGSVRVTQSTAGVPGTPEPGDRFGAAVAVADADGDGTADLVIGGPGEDVDGAGTDAGTVAVLRGGAGGFGTGFTAVNGPSASAAYGKSLAAADLTGDAKTDLAVGATDKVVLRTSAGVLSTVFTGSMGGRAPVMTTGDFDDDGTADLATGYWTVDDPFTQSHVRLWSWDATESVLANIWNTDNSGVSALAAGDFDGDGHDDLVLGECREIADENIDDPCGPEATAKGGGVHIEYGGPEGWFGGREQTLNQDTAGVPGVAETGDRFGAALAVRDIDGDGRDDLVAGAPGEAIGTVSKAGAVTVLFGTASGLADASGRARSVAYNQDTTHVMGIAEAGDAFGGAATVSDFDHDGSMDLAVGSPGENAKSGGVWIFRAASAVHSYTITPSQMGLPSPASALGYGGTLSSH